jgi:dipeptidyl aminopeptidase/acylaminoacyl peptidase
MKPTYISFLFVLALTGCNRSADNSSNQADNQWEQADSLTEARKGFETNIVRSGKALGPARIPPADLFQFVRYEAQPGKLGAYLTPDPNDGKKHPAIIWIAGGDSNSIDEGCWKAQPFSNDQSASAFRKAGIVMMFPSLRGGNDNPGVKESFLGEVDDVLAAAEFLSKEKYVDPARIYLGGHSTGGTLVLLVAECSDRFRAIFSFGPVEDVKSYPSEYITFDTSNRREVRLRSPGYWLASIKSPTFVMEGTNEGNMGALRTMGKFSTNKNVHFLPVVDATHFTILAPTNSLIADKILHDEGDTCKLNITTAELNKYFNK